MKGMLEHYGSLTEHRFSHTEIVQIAGNNGGARALRAVLDYRDSLTTRDFTNTEIVKIAGNIGRDERKREALEAAGWTVLIIWEHDEIAEAVERIKAVMTAARILPRNNGSTTVTRRKRSKRSFPDRVNCSIDDARLLRRTVGRRLLAHIRGGSREIDYL